MGSSGHGTKGKDQGSKSSDKRSPEGPTPNLLWGQTKPRPTPPTKPDGRPKPELTTQQSPESQHKKKKSKKHSSSSIETNHDDRSSWGKSKSSEKPHRDNRWTCSNCNVSNLSLKRDAICPACHVQRSSNAVTYFATSDRSENTVDMDNSGDHTSSLGYSAGPLSEVDNRGGFLPPTDNSRSTVNQNNYYPTLDPSGNTVNTTGFQQSGYYYNDPNSLQSYQTASNNMRTSPIDHNNDGYYTQPLDETQDTFDQDSYDYGDTAPGTHYDGY